MSHATQHVQFCTTSQRTLFKYVEGAYTLRNDRPHPWLQRIALWVLKKLDCVYMRHEFQVERHIIDTGRLVDTLCKQRQELMLTYHKHGSRLLIGAEEYTTLMGEELRGTMFSFSTEYGYSSMGKVFGLEVTVIPWMKGLLVVPELP